MSKKIFIIIISFLLLLLVFLFLVWPKYQELTEINAKIDSKETELRYAKEHFSELKKLSQKLEEYQAQLAKVDSALPSNAPLSLLSVINFLQKEASNNGLIFKNLNSTFITLPKTSAASSKRTATPKSVTNIKEIKIDFELTGTYPALKNFLRVIENSARIIDVENLSFSFEESPIFSFFLSVKTYSY